MSLYPLGDDYEITNGVVTKHASFAGLGLVAKRVGSSTYWLHTDRLGSARAVTDASGALVQRRTYRPYGENISDTTQHVESRGYIGERLDDDTGLTYLHARYYDAALGIFVSPDPLHPATAGVGFNRYAYAMGGPTNASDPTGLYYNQLCGHPAFGDGGDCGGGGSGGGGWGYYFIPGGGIGLTANLTGNAALDELNALQQRLGFTTFTKTYADRVETITWAAAGPVSVTTQPIVQPATFQFKVPVVKGAPSVRGEFFIQTPSTMFGQLKGDNRSFDPAPNPHDSRVFFEVNFQTGQGFVQVNPTCHPSGACTSAYPIGGGRNTFIIGEIGTSVSLTGSMHNSRLPGPSIDFSILFTPSSQGVAFSGSRDSYPSFELTSSAGGFATYAETNPMGLFGPDVPFWGFFPAGH